MQRLRFYQGLLLVLLAFALVGCDANQADVSLQGGKDTSNGKLDLAQTGGVDVGNAAHDFTLSDYRGGQLNLKQHAAGNKLTLVNFWASWCADCRAEMPDLEDSYAKYKAQGFSVVGVDIGEDAATVKQIAAPDGKTTVFSFPLVLDGDRAVTKAYALGATPSSFFVDSQGIIRHVQLGPLNPKQLADLLKQFGFSN